MEGIYNEHANLGGAGSSVGGGFGVMPILGGGYGGGFGFGGNTDFLSLIIGLKALDSFGFGGHRRDWDRDLLTKDDLIQKTLGGLKGNIKDNRADILSAIIDGKCDVKDTISHLQSAMSGEFRDIGGKLCDLRHDAVMHAFQTRVDIKDAKCDLENKVEKSKDSIQASIRDLKDDINDRFSKLREGQLLSEIREQKRDLDELRERLNRDKTVQNIFDRLREDRHFRREDRDDCGFNFRRWPTASVPAEVQAPLVAFAESDPCNVGASLAKTK